jgi:hypothetical protein
MEDWELLEGESWYVSVRHIDTFGLLICYVVDEDSSASLNSYSFTIGIE